MNGRVMAVDPGAKRIGLAISDETGTLARGLSVIKHVSMKEDCQKISRMAAENEVKIILVGNPLGESGEERPQTRHAKKLAEMLAEFSGLQVHLVDESGSTQQARNFRLQAGANRTQRSGHLDDAAAAVILQNWLDMNQKEQNA